MRVLTLDRPQRRNALTPCAARTPWPARWPPTDGPGTAGGGGRAVVLRRVRPGAQLGQGRRGRPLARRAASRTSWRSSRPIPRPAWRWCRARRSGPAASWPAPVTSGWGRPRPRSACRRCASGWSTRRMGCGGSRAWPGCSTPGSCSSPPRELAAPDAEAWGLLDRGEPGCRRAGPGPRCRAGRGGAAGHGRAPARPSSSSAGHRSMPPQPGRARGSATGKPSPPPMRREARAAMREKRPRAGRADRRRRRAEKQTQGMSSARLPWRAASASSVRTSRAKTSGRTSSGTTARHGGRNASRMKWCAKRARQRRTPSESSAPGRPRSRIPRVGGPPHRPGGLAALGHVALQRRHQPGCPAWVTAWMKAS